MPYVDDKIKREFFNSLEALGIFENGKYKTFCYLLVIYNLFFKAKNNQWTYPGNFSRCAMIIFKSIQRDTSKDENEIIDRVGLITHKYVYALSTKNEINVDPLREIITGLRENIIGKRIIDEEKIALVEKEAAKLRGKNYRENYLLLETIGKIARQ